MTDIGGGVRFRGSDRVIAWDQLELCYMPLGTTVSPGMLHPRAGAITVAAQGERTRVSHRINLSEVSRAINMLDAEPLGIVRAICGLLVAQGRVLRESADNLLAALTSESD